MRSKAIFKIFSWTKSKKKEYRKIDKVVIITFYKNNSLSNITLIKFFIHEEDLYNYLVKLYNEQSNIKIQIKNR